MGTVVWIATAGCGAAGPEGEPSLGTVTQTTGDKGAAVLIIGRMWALMDAAANQRLNDVSLLPTGIVVLAADATFGDNLGKSPLVSLPPRPPVPAGEASTRCDASGCAFVDYLQDTLYADRVEGAVTLTSTGNSRQLSIGLVVRDGPSAAVDFTQVIDGAIEVTGTTMRGELTSWNTMPEAGNRTEIQTLVIEGVDSIDSRAALVGTDPSSGTVTVTSMSGRAAEPYDSRRAVITFP